MVCWGLSLNVNLAHFGGSVPESLVFVFVIYLLFVNEGYQVHPSPTLLPTTP